MTCRKRRYVSRLEAQIALASTALKGKRNSARAQRREELREYFCGSCGGWHLTHERKRRTS